jgi:hypothetical protein
MMLDNPHNITKELYGIYLAQSEEVLRVLRVRKQTLTLADAIAEASSPPKEFGREHSMSLIDVDLPRTFSYLSFFLPDGPLHGSLRRILQVLNVVAAAFS